jgi:hypothetical protein
MKASAVSVRGGGNPSRPCPRCGEDLQFVAANGKWQAHYECEECLTSYVLDPDWKYDSRKPRAPSTPNKKPRRVLIEGRRSMENVWT